jgi:hypothetical protein
MKGDTNDKHSLYCNADGYGIDWNISLRPSTCCRSTNFRGQMDKQAWYSLCLDILYRHVLFFCSWEMALDRKVMPNHFSVALISATVPNSTSQ